MLLIYGFYFPVKMAAVDVVEIQSFFGELLELSNALENRDINNELHLFELQERLDKAISCLNLINEQLPLTRAKIMPLSYQFRIFSEEIRREILHVEPNLGIHRINTPDSISNAIFHFCYLAQA